MRHDSSRIDCHTGARACGHFRLCQGSPETLSAAFRALRPVRIGAASEDADASAQQGGRSLHRERAANFGFRNGSTRAAPRPFAEAKRAVADVKEALPRSSMADEISCGRRLVVQARALMIRLAEKANAGETFDSVQCWPVLDPMIDSLLRHREALPALVRSKTGEDDHRSMHAVAVCVSMLAVAATVGFDREVCRQAGLVGLLHEFGTESAGGEPRHFGCDRRCPEVPGLPCADFASQRAGPLVPASPLNPWSSGAGRHSAEIEQGHDPGTTLPLVLQMLMLCGAYDDFISGGPRLAACDPALAIELLCVRQVKVERWLRQSFVATIGRYPIGSLVRLRSGRLGVVMENCPTRPLCPRVRVFHSATTLRPLVHKIVDLASAAVDDGLDGRAPRFGWQFTDLDSLWLP